ncbi:hypothetical protein [Staphylococcus petrasii]|uniref:hypothetical protein n=1 Tax=Staphylococcus petrasii TaxID=1276936 RepID=UPI000CD0ED69|nr:hypothetical protein [Staphylococcus petrasii]MCI2774769.1 hypothetical protein [Staphylococcus petrasii]PNZ84378.1 hypothetical protein CD127_02060 [Staphylococcus petrasii]TGA81804.1 hypothetical protein E2554_09885 [Staphylococcus petrasii]SUM59304.1 Uncharacterised protein [Staphylococcus petrasii]
MTQTLRELITEKVYDMYDDLKVKLIEINQSKQLFMNGPSQELMKRAFNISYYQGEKQAIEAIQKIIEDNKEESVLVEQLRDYQIRINDKLSNLAEMMHRISEPQFKLEEVLDQHYHYLGQSYIITQVDNMIKEVSE